LRQVWSPAFRRFLRRAAKRRDSKPSFQTGSKIRRSLRTTSTIAEYAETAFCVRVHMRPGASPAGTLSPLDRSFHNVRNALHLVWQASPRWTLVSMGLVPPRQPGRALRTQPLPERRQPIPFPALSGAAASLLVALTHGKTLPKGEGVFVVSGFFRVWLDAMTLFVQSPSVKQVFSSKSGQSLVSMRWVLSLIQTDRA
jgi:hypothetical protein